MSQGVHRAEPRAKPNEPSLRARGAGAWSRIGWRAPKVALWAALLLVSACGRTAPPTAPEARPIEIDVPTEPATLDPRYSTDAVAIRVTRLMHAGLVRLDPDSLQPVPYAAERWQFRDDRTLEIELRAGARFHSGRSLTAVDVCATLDALVDPALLSPHRTVVESIATCTPQTERTLVIRLRAPHATLLTDLEVPILRADQARVPPRPQGDLDGLGPYRVDRATRGSIELVPANTGILMPTRAVVVRTVRDENARALRLLTGRADIAPNAVSPLLWQTLARHGATIRRRPGANVTYLVMQNARAPFDRVEVRSAISSAVDRNLITGFLFEGAAHAANSVFPPGSMAHVSTAPPMSFDPGRARTTLERVQRPLTLLTSTDRFRTRVARFVAQQLTDAGLSIELVPLDLGTLLQRLAAGDFDMAMLQMPELTEPNLLRWFFHSGHIPSFEHPNVGANRARYQNSDVDRWLDEAAAAPAPIRRKELYALVSNQLAADMPIAPLWHEDQVAVVSERAKSFELSAEGRWLSVAALR